MKNKDIRKQMRKVTKAIREVNNNIKNDSLLLGRFCIVPIHIDAYRYPDGFGAICRYYLVFIDKETDVQALAIVDSCHHTLDADLYNLMNNFIVDYMAVATEPNPHDYTKIKPVVKKHKLTDYKFDELLRK